MKNIHSYKKRVFLIDSEHLRIIEVQWNPVNPTTDRPPKSGRINGVVVLKGFLNKKITDRT